MKRGAGLLLHLTSLPSEFGIGDLGPEAYRFVDFLHESRLTYWQILPLSPTMAYTANSPYSSYSTYAGNTLLISPEQLVADGWCDSPTIERHRLEATDRVLFEKVYASRHSLLREVFDINRERLKTASGFLDFCQKQADWLSDFALYVALKDQLGDRPWTDWPRAYRDREPSALTESRNRLAEPIRREQFYQYLFFEQWQALRSYANDKSVAIIGDLPIYVSLDSADVWCDPEVFKLDQNQQPTGVAGVPPDYFSETGQHWGNPVYDWATLKDTKFDWWLNRIGHTLELYDIFRLDHFRGLVAYWEIPAGEESAVNGHWEQVPVEDFFEAVYQRFPKLQMIAEDLGTITDDVCDVMKRLSLPGMRIFQFGFSGDLEGHPYLPHNYIKNCVAYTGTHDNNTTAGWFADDIDGNLRKIVRDYLGHEGEDDQLPWTIIDRLCESAADVVIIPVQDILGLSSSARFNEPSTTNSNWLWRLLPEQLNLTLSDRLAGLISRTNR